MRHSLLRKNVNDVRVMATACSLLMFAFCWVRVWIVSLFPTDRFQTIVEQFREFERFIPVSFEQLFTYSGRLALTYDELLVIMCMSIWAIGRGSDCVAGELSRGTLEMLLAQPISRLRLLLTHTVVTLCGVALLATASWLGIFAGIHTTSIEEPVESVGWPLPLMTPAPLPSQSASDTRRTPMSEKVDARVLWPAAVNLAALGCFLAALSTLISSCDRYRWRTIGIVSAFFVVQMIIKIVGLASDSLSWLSKFTFFSAYDPERFVSIAVHSPQLTWRLTQVEPNGITRLAPLGCDLILVALAAACYAGAAWVFARRDLPAPV